MRKRKQGHVDLPTQFLRAAGGGEGMRHQIPGLHSKHQDPETSFDGVFLVRVDRAWYRRYPQKPFVELRFVILEPQPFQGRSFFSRLYSPARAFWTPDWFILDFPSAPHLL